MAQRTPRSNRVIGVLADLTGRSDAEIKLMLGGVLAAAGIAVAIRIFKVLADLGPPPSGGPASGVSGTGR